MVFPIPKFLTKFHCLIVFTSWVIGQYVYCKYFLTRLWCHKFWNWRFLSNQAVFVHDQKSQDKNINILRTEELLKKTFFVYSEGLSFAVTCLKPESAPLKLTNCWHHMLYIYDVITFLQHVNVKTLAFILKYWQN